MTEDPQDRPWLREGARVAVVRGYGMNASVSPVTIKTIGKLHITIEGSDERFRVGTLDSTKSRGAWDPRTRLADPASAEVRELLAERRLDRARLAVGVKHDEWRRARGGEDELAALGALRAAVRKLEELLNS